MSPTLPPEVLEQLGLTPTVDDDGPQPGDASPYEQPHNPRTVAEPSDTASTRPTRGAHLPDPHHTPPPPRRSVQYDR